MKNRDNLIKKFKKCFLVYCYFKVQSYLYISSSPQVDNLINLMIINSTKLCPVCQNAVPQSLYPTAMIQKFTDSLFLENHMICISCEKQFIMLKNHQEENKLNFGKGSSKGKQLVNIYIGLSKNTIERQSSILKNGYSLTNYPGYNASDQQFYISLIQNIIRKSKLYQSDILPNNIRQLVYYSTINVISSERHQRVRNTLLRVMVGHALPISVIQSASILIQFLLCYLHDFEVYLILGKLSEAVMQLPEENEGWGRIYQGIWAHQLFDCISHIIREGMSATTYYLTHKLVSKTTISQQNNKEKKTDKLQLSLNLSKQTIKMPRRFSINSPNILDFQCNCMEIYQNQSFKQLTRIKNHCNFIMASFLQEQKHLKSLISQIEAKYKKQKQEYISKIINLKQKIASLEGKIIQQTHTKDPEDQQNQNLIHKDLKGIAKTKVDKKWLNSKKLIRDRKKSINQPKVQQITSSKKQQKIQIIQDLLFDQKIKRIIKKLICQTNIIPLPSLDEKNLKIDIVDNIIENINILQQKVNNLLTKNKQFETEVRRLLQILKRKEQKFIPLIHQKDQIIQMHQNALWKLQNGLQMGSNKLAPRVELIRQLQYQRILTKGRQSLETQIKDVNIKKKAKDKNFVKQNKQSNKIKDQNKQSCQIY